MPSKLLRQKGTNTYEMSRDSCTTTPVRLRGSKRRRGAGFRFEDGSLPGVTLTSGSGCVNLTAVLVSTGEVEGTVTAQP